MHRILVIDDDSALRALSCRVLQNAGYAADSAPDGVDGLRLLGENDYDLVITDIMMERMDGLDLILECRSRYPELKFIAMSGAQELGVFDALPAAEALGALVTLSKPFSKVQLLAAVRRSLGMPE